MADKPEFLLKRFKSNVKEFGSKTAVSFLGSDGSIKQQKTYKELAKNTDAIASHILEQGLKPGDRAVLVYPPSIDFMIAFIACIKAGVIVVPVFPPNPARRDTLQMFSVIVASCGATFALTSKEYKHMKTLGSIKDTLSSIMLKGKRKTAEWPNQLNWIVTNSKDAVGIDSKPPKLSPKTDDIAFLQYTSGSTSEPKGVMITHGNLAHNLTIITNELKAKDDTVVVSWLPQYHDMGLIGSYLGVLYCGGSGFYMSPLSFLARPMLWIESVSKYKATHLQAPNFSFKLTARKFEASHDLDLSSVRHIINAAEPVDEESMESFYKVFGQYGLKRVIYPTYGLAEHTVFVCSGGTEKLSVDKRALEIDGKVKLVEGGETTRMIGCGVPSHQKVIVEIVDPESLKALDDDCVGEIWVSSPSKAAGYYRKEAESKENFQVMLTGDDNNLYLRTGDLGFLHRGELFICGRIKDLIIIGGRNYYPQDLEGTAEACSEDLRPGCSAAFTIDPTHEGGEEVAMVVELRQVPQGDPEPLCNQLAGDIRAAINQEHSVSLVDIVFLRPRTVPKTSSGKIARSWCRKAYVTGTLKTVYRKSYRKTSSSLEIEAGEQSKEATQQQKKLSVQEINTIRTMNEKDILKKLVTDVSRLSGVPEDSISVTAAIASLLDSMSLVQFKSMIEQNYALYEKMSDEYMFRETTTLRKLASVVRLGHAPDDGENTMENHGRYAGDTEKAKGLAGALGCPPGVVCTIL